MDLKQAVRVGRTPHVFFSSIFTAGTEIRAVFYDGASLPDRRFHAGIFLEKFSENVLRALGAGYFA